MTSIRDAFAERKLDLGQDLGDALPRRASQVQLSMLSRPLSAVGLTQFHAILPNTDDNKMLSRAVRSESRWPSANSRAGFDAPDVDAWGSQQPVGFVSASPVSRRSFPSAERN